MRTKFLPENRAAVIARLEVGLTLRESAEGAGLKRETVQGWVARGHREESGEYHDFAAAVDRAKAANKREQMTPDEHRAKVSEVARTGNVPALKLMWEIIRAENGDADETEKPEAPLAGVDDLSVRRAARA